MLMQKNVKPQKKTTPSALDMDTLPDYNDTIYEDCKFVLIFCTAEIPSSIINNLLSHSRQPILNLGAKIAYFICDGKTGSILDVVVGAREPYPEFESPFLGHTVEQVYQAFLGSASNRPLRNGHFILSTHTSLVLDAGSLLNPPTALVAIDNLGTLETIRVSFLMSLRLIHHIEDGAMNIPFAEARVVDADGVLTRESWNRWKLLKEGEDVAEILVDENGDRWLELVDDDKRRLGVVHREKDGDSLHGYGKNLWKDGRIGQLHRQVP